MDTDRKALQEAAEIARRQVDKVAEESAEKIKERVALVEADSDTFWAWWGRTSPGTQTESREPVNCYPAPVEKGSSGSKSKSHKKPKKKSDFARRYQDI